MPNNTTLFVIKAAHSLIWGFFVSCIVGIPVFTWLGSHEVALWLVAVVLIEVAVLLLNKWSCPLTAVAAKYTNDRSENFDIYLPRLLAKYNKQFFGSLYIVGTIYAIASWLQPA